MTVRSVLRLAALLFLSACLLACTANPALEESRQAFASGNTEAALRVRPAWAHSCGCKSRRKLITANEVKRNCVRVTERGEEAWSVICEPMNKNRIEGAAEQGERARNREALVIKARWRKSGGCAAKECVLTWGDLASCLKGRR